MINVVHLWRSPAAEGGGGGGLSMLRLHRSLLGAGHGSRILCDADVPDEPGVERIARWRAVDGVTRRLVQPSGLNDVHRLSSFSVRWQKTVRTADVLHIHGTHSGFFNYLALPGLGRTAPLVFTLHDMWPLTGHCAMNFDCDRWRHGCGHCPYPDAHPAVRRDATRVEYRLKVHVYRRTNMEVVAVSQEYADRARTGLLSRFRTRAVLGAVDLQVFRPRSRSEARRRLGLPEQGLIVLAAANDLRARQKGMDLLIQALGHLPVELRGDIHLVTVGHGGDAVTARSPVRAVSLGFLGDRELMATAFAASDVFVVPSRVETFGLVAAESLACGIPVVAFAIGGLPEVIDDERTGLLASPEDPADLAQQLMRLLGDAPLRRALASEAVEVATDRFSPERERDEYLAIYRDAIAATSQR